MSGAVYARTPNLGLGLLEFDFPNWADDANLNTKIIDAGFSFFGISIKGAWQNNTPYINGDLVVDTDDNTLWRAMIAHTSAATGTFADERAANPLFWTDATQSIHARGAWQPSTQYYLNDIVYKDEFKQVWAIATKQYVSGTTFDADVANGSLVVITDLSVPVTDAETAATEAAASAASAAAHDTNAQNAASSAIASATNAGVSATNAANSATAAAGSATNAATSAANALTSANNADASEADAEAAAAQALALFNAMMPDAPSDGYQYGRRNAAWSRLVASTTPSDTPPASPVNGQLWYETDSGNTFVWYDDGTSAQWVQVNIINNPDTYTKAESDSKFVDVAGDTMTGDLAINHAGISNLLVRSPDNMATILLDKGLAGSYSYIAGRVLDTGAYKMRWLQALGNSDAESGSNAGSNYELRAYADNGSTILGYPLRFTRSTLLGTVAGDPTAALGIATKQYVDNKPAGTTISDTPPGSPSQGQTWWESDSGAFYINYNDGNSSQWVQINGQSGGNVIGPAGATDNAFVRFDTTTGKLIQDSQVSADDAGNVYAAGQIAALNGTFVGATSQVVIGPQTPGTVYIRPQGTGSATNEARAYNDGTFNVGTGYTVAGATNWVKKANLFTSGYSLSSAAVYATGATGVHQTFWTSVMDNFTEPHMAAGVSPANCTTPGTARNVDLPASYTSFFTYGAGGTGTMYVYQEYFAGSPPYDFGDGEIPPGGFVFVEIDKGTGWIRQVGFRGDPPWYGDATPSRVYPDHYIEGKPYMWRKRINGKAILTAQDLRDTGMTMREAVTAFAKAEKEEVEITVAMKNTDWAYLPTPMAFDPAVRDGTAEQFILDPFDPVTQELVILHNEGHHRLFHDLLHKDGNPSDILIDAATPLTNRKGPPGATIIKARWR